MGIREALNKNTRLGVGVGVVLVLAGLAFAVYEMRDEGSVGTAPERAFFTVDDGATYYVDSINNVPPYNTKEGKTAYRAFVVTCGKGAPKVLYLTRFKPNAKAALEKAQADPAWAQNNTNELREAYALGMECKKPGDPTWFPSMQQERITALAKAACPGGGRAELIYP